MTEDYETLKARFFQAFANVPAPLRKEIIAVIGGESFSWYTANGEIEHNTPRAGLILKQLHGIKVI